MEVVDYYFYTKEHEWVSIEDDIATIGITDYAQEQLGDITFIELPSVGQEIEQFEEFAAIESVKAANDIFAPISGKITEVNNCLEADPGLINRSAYEKGWLAKVKISDPEETSSLMTSEEYLKFLKNVS